MTGAVTPEQLIRKFDEGWEVFLSWQLSDLSKQIALAELAEAIRQYGREAEANALRRAAEMCAKEMCWRCKQGRVLAHSAVRKKHGFAPLKAA